MKKWILIIVLGCAQFVMVLDSTVMNVSISTVVKDLNTSVSALQAAITFYTLTMAALMLTGGKLGDKFGRLKAFKIGAVIYALGSLITALSPNIATLFVGWSVIEGLGAVLVIPAIAALIAVNYKGKDRVIGFTIIGAASGIAVALGPVIGGFMTTYLSWRYVFIGEVIVMAAILLYSFTLSKEAPLKTKLKLDGLSILLSVVGMVLLVFGILQSKTWGWITPKAIPQIGSVEIAPLGVSVVIYLIIGGIVILWLFAKRQMWLEKVGKIPLLQVSMLKLKVLRSGLAVLSGQYLITAAVFFVIPVYLQMVLGLDALQTGLKILPLSFAIVLFSFLGSRLIDRFSPKQIVRLGQIFLVVGTIALTGAVNPQLNGLLFGSALFLLGCGLGLLVSQIGNVTMSAVSEQKSSEVGGLQGTFQNLGSSLGTALVGSVLISTLTTNFITSINSNPQIPSNVAAEISQKTTAGVPIVPANSITQAALSAGLNQEQAQEISTSYLNSQLSSLKVAMTFLVILALLTLAFSRNIPNNKLIS